VAAFLLDNIGHNIAVPYFYALAGMGVLLLAAAMRTGGGAGCWRHSCWPISLRREADLGISNVFGNISYPLAFNGKRFVGRSRTHRSFHGPARLDRSSPRGRYVTCVGASCDFLSDRCHC